MSSPYPWSVLGIAPGSDKAAIRKAYATAIKGMDLDADPQAYARLRAARDRALQLAKSALTDPHSHDEPYGHDETFSHDETSEPDVGKHTLAIEEEPAQATSESWPLAAPQIDTSQPHGTISTRAETFVPDKQDEGFRNLFLTVPADRGTGETLDLGRHEGLGAPLLQGYGEIEAALGLVPGQTAFERLETVLSEDEHQPLDEPSRIVAQRALNMVIEEARAGNITHQERVEDYIAQILTNASPRSDPLLETATAAFQWDEEWHRFDARPTVRYLGSRLRGERFRQKVEDPQHRYHKAWRELKRPGPAGLLRGLRASHKDIQFLLKGIRDNFPHIEDELDAARIHSWSGKISWRPIIVGLLIAAFMLARAESLMHFFSGSADDPAVATAPLTPASPPPVDIRPQVDAAIAEGFGEGHDMDWLRQEDPDLLQALSGQANTLIAANAGANEIAQALANTIRRYTLAKSSTLTGSDLDALMHVRLGLLRATQAYSAQDCISLLNTGKVPVGTPLPADLQASERAVALRLVKTPLPVARAPGADSKTKHFSIPGPLVSAVMKKTGYDRDTVQLAFQNKSDETHRCASIIALIEATLDWTDTKSEDRRTILQSL